MDDNNIIAQYDVDAYVDSETIHDYVGNDLDEATKSFEMLKSITVVNSHQCSTECQYLSNCC